ncbi:hypothetical protein ACFLZ2_04225 [Candidatus Margulisiibacteriota bacterium]
MNSPVNNNPNANIPSTTTHSTGVGGNQNHTINLQAILSSAQKHINFLFNRTGLESIKVTGPQGKTFTLNSKTQLVDLNLPYDTAAKLANKLQTTVQDSNSVTTIIRNVSANITKTHEVNLTHETAKAKTPAQSKPANATQAYAGTINGKTIEQLNQKGRVKQSDATAEQGVLAVNSSEVSTEGILFMLAEIEGREA